MTETIDSANAAASTLFLGHNGEWWDFWLIVAVIFAAFAAAFIGIATAGSIVSHKREAVAAEVALDRFKIETEGKISESTMRAAEANARALEAKLELEKLKAPRVLSVEQQLRIATKLKQLPTRQFDIAMPPGDSEAARLMAILVTVLRDAGWTQIGWKYPAGFQGLLFNTSGFEPAGNVTIEGLTITGPASDGAIINAVVESLNSEGIPADTLGVVGISNDNPNAIHVLIGRK